LRIERGKAEKDDNGEDFHRGNLIGSAYVARLDLLPQCKAGRNVCRKKITYEPSVYY
jgi:hypothetical protein